MAEPKKKKLKLTRARNFCFTWNNFPTDGSGARLLLALPYKYIIFGEEKGESGTPHYQGYVELKKQMSYSAFKKKTSKKIHLEPRRGTAAQAAAYCQKEGGIITEDGEISKQGKRTDLIELKDKLKAGTTTVDDITMENPMAYHQYGRTLEKIQDIQNRKKYRTQMTKGIWFHGPTGTGKTHAAFKDYNPDTHYVWKDDKGWQDGYTGQGIVIINDFRGAINYNEMLQMVDKFPYFVKRRNREPAPFLAKTVIVTSSLRPEEVYNRRNEKDKIEQLLRRFEIIEKNTVYEKRLLRRDATAAEAGPPGWGPAEKK